MLDFTLGVISLIREYFVSDKRWLLLLAVPPAWSPRQVSAWSGSCLACVGCEVLSWVLCPAD